MAAFFATIFALFPAVDSRYVLLDGGAAAGLTIVALLTWFVAPRAGNGWPLDLVIVGCAAVAGIGVTEIHTPEGQLVVGIGLVPFGVFAAYFRPAFLFAVELTFILAAYGIGLLLNPDLASPIYFLIVVTVVCAVSILVAVLAQRLRDQALRDSLTGLFNRRGLEVMSGPIRAAAVRLDAPVTVAVFDLDDFKELNDREGHLAGDRLLVDLAEAWREELRGSDLLTRFGGDEFVAVLPGTDRDNAETLAARIRGSYPVSVGFAEWRADEDLYTALARADQDLYRDKDRERTGNRAIDAKPRVDPA
jgi:diguanylate cyclase (GGDEF)-like protein